jgi:hypothetical protein
MAALLQLARMQGTASAAAIVARLYQDIAVTLSRQAQRRPALVRHRSPDANGRPACHRDVALPDIPTPPH